MDVHEETGGRLRALLDDAGAPALRGDLLDEALARGGRLRRRRAARRTVAGSLCAAAVVAGAWAGLPGPGGRDREALPAGRPSASATPTRPTVLDQLPAALVARFSALFPPTAALDGDHYASAPWVGTDQPAVLGGMSCDPSVVGRLGAGVVRNAGVATQSIVRAGRLAPTDVGQLTISRWPDARGWTQVVTNTGTCRWQGVVRGTYPGGDRPDRLWMVGSDDPARVVAVRRVGRMVVSAAVRRETPEASTAEAVRLVDILATNVAAHGWPTAAVAP